MISKLISHNFSICEVGASAELLQPEQQRLLLLPLQPSKSRTHACTEPSLHPSQVSKSCKV